MGLIHDPVGREPVDHLTLFLVQVLIIITLVRLLGRVLVKIRQPMVIGGSQTPARIFRHFSRLGFSRC